MIKKIFITVTFLAPSLLWASGNTGGMDGGGGGTLPAHPATTYDIERLAVEAQPALTYIFNAYEMSERHSSKKPLYQKLFGGTQRVQDKLKELRLEVLDRNPCHTSTGAEVDASIHGSKPNTICLSSYRISQKIDQAAIEREVLALLAHEVSHFLGATEDEARKLQEDVAWSIQRSKPDSAPKGEILRTEFDGFESLLSRTIDLVKKSELVQAEQQLTNATTALFNFSNIASDSTYQVFGLRERDYQDLLLTRLISAEMFLRTLIPSEDQQRHIEDYNLNFKGRDFFLFLENTPPGVSHVYRHERVMKLKTQEELLQLLKILKEEYEVRSAYLYQMTFGNRWLKLDGHLTIPSQNPWEELIGRYKVESAQCGAGNNSHLETEFEIYKNDSGLYLKRVFPSMWGSDRLELGAYNVNVYLNGYGKDTDGSIYMIHERGGTWSSGMYIDTFVSDFRIKKTAPNRFEAVRVDSHLPKEMSRPDEVTTCKYEGVIL